MEEHACNIIQVKYFYLVVFFFLRELLIIIINILCSLLSKFNILLCWVDVENNLDEPSPKPSLKEVSKILGSRLVLHLF